MGNKTPEDKKIQSSIKKSYIKSQKWLRLGALQFYNADQPSSHWQQVLIRKDWSKLQGLELNSARFRADNLKILIEMKWNRLQYLKIKRDPIGNLGIKYLVKSQMPVLEGIQLVYCQVGDEGVKHLTKGKWKSLRSLSIYSYLVKNNGSELIYGNWTNLKDILVLEDWICRNQQQNIYIVTLGLICGCPIQTIVSIGSCNQLCRTYLQKILYRKIITN